MKEFYDFHRPCAEKIEAAVIHRFFCTFHRSCGQIEENKAPGKIEDIQRNGGLVVPPAARSFLSAREKIGEKRAPWGTGLYRVDFRQQIRLLGPASTGLPYDV